MVAVAPQTPCPPARAWLVQDRGGSSPPHPRHPILSRASLLWGPNQRDGPVSPTPPNLPASAHRPLTFSMDASLRNSMRSSLSLLWFSSRTSGWQGRGCQGPGGGAAPPSLPGWALTELELQALLQLVNLLGELAQHGAQEGDLLVLLGQGHVHLVEAVVGLLEELLQALKAARLQVRLIRVLVPDERAPGGAGELPAPLLTCPPIRTLPSASSTLKISRESRFCTHCNPDGPPSSPRLHAHPSLPLPSAPSTRQATMQGLSNHSTPAQSS